MSVILVKALWTPTSGEETVLEDLESLNIKRESEAKASYATLTLKNPLDKIVTGFDYALSKYVSKSNEIKFSEGDTIKIYLATTDVVRDVDTSADSTDLIMTGEVAEVKVKAGEKGSKITLKVVDKTWVILNKLWVFNYKNSLGLNAPQIIQRVIRAVTDEVSQDAFSYDNDGNFVKNGRYLVDARLKTGDYPGDEGAISAYMENERADSSAFPTTQMAKVYKPAYEFIQDLSTMEYTNDFTTEDEEDPPQDRTMIFYIDERNRFHWFYPNDTVGDGLTFVEGTNTDGNVVIDSNLTYKTFDITNLVYFSAGNDLLGSGISSYLYDKNTNSKDFKTVHKPYTEIAKDYIDAEIKAGNLVLDNAQTVFTYEGNFYKSKGYNFVTEWGTTVTSDATYNAALRTICITKGKGKAMALVNKKGNPRWKGTVECKFKVYTAGDLLQFTSTRIGINERKLRIKTVQYNITKNGGFVTLTVEEDEKKRGDS